MRSRFAARSLEAAATAVRALLHLAGIAAACALWPLVAQANDLPDDDILAPEAPAQAVIEASLDKTLALRADGPVGRIVVSQPELLEAGQAGAREIYLIGRELGTTNLLVYDTGGRLTQTLDVRVGYDAQAVRDTLALALPDEEIAVTALASGLLLEGQVSSPAAAEAALKLAQATAPDAVVSRLAVRNATVRIDVRIVEVSQTRLREVGAGISLDDGHTAIAARTGRISPTPAVLNAALDTHLGQHRLQAALRALEASGEARLLAEPTLVAHSKEEAQFHAGGELAIPVPDDGEKVIIEFRPYGVALKMRPEVRSNGSIRLEILAEASEPDPQNGVSIFGVEVPALMVRRVATTADLRDGETFMLAGLFQEDRREQSLSSPGLARAPPLGGFLRTVQTRDARRELAILVTPHLDDPGSSAQAVRVAAATPVGTPPVETPPAVASTLLAEPDPAPRRQARGLFAEVKAILAPPARWIGGKVRSLFRRT
ncbi:pilus assembly protein N-terminal domain-containing protein [Phenylobacterium sp.]|uniref:type II and III secretion system protein family protein n=1 Tax=Phenylobacterium sp. TaxID=1871053 RepID=UPI00301DDA22